MRRALIAGLIALAATGVAACGDDEEDLGPDTPQEREVARTYTDYINALKRLDGEAACNLLTPAFQARAGASIAVGTRAELKGAACPTAIEQGTLPQIKQVVPNLQQIRIAGKRASGFDPGEGLIGPQKVFFERLGGEWKISRTVFFERKEGTAQGSVEVTPGN